MVIKAKVNILDYDKLIKKNGFGWAGSMAGKVAATSLGNKLLKKMIQKYLKKNEIDVEVESVSVERADDLYDLSIEMSDDSYTNLIYSLYKMVKTKRIKISEDILALVMKHEKDAARVIDALASMSKETYVDIVNYAGQFSEKIVSAVNESLRGRNGEAALEILSASLFALEQGDRGQVLS